MTPEKRWQQATELHQQGRLEEAEALYREFLQADPDHVAANHMLGMLLHQREQNAEALRYLERALDLGGEQPPILANTAKVHIGMGEPGRAMSLLERALRHDPRHFGSLYNQALVYRLLGKPTEALAFAERAAVEQPKNADVYLLEAALLSELGRFGDQRTALERALENGADQSECRVDIAATWAQQNNRGAALKVLAGLEASNLTQTDLVYRVALIYQQLGAWVDVLEWVNEVISRDAGHVEALLRRGLAAALLGAPQPAIEDYRRVLAIDPAYHQVHSNLLSRLQYDYQVSAQEVLAAHCEWAVQHANSAPRSASSFTHDRDPNRALNIGWLSPRFDSSLVVSFLPATLKAVPANEFKYFFYNTRKGAGNIPPSLSALGLWRLVDGLNDAELARQLAADGVDILVDLTGHNPGNRLLAIAKRMAPVQLSWLDYFSTTGIPAIDYWLTDPHLSPLGSERFFSESLMYFPHTRLCYSAPDIDNTPQRSPRAAGEVVFGSFNRLGKLVDEVVLLWADIVNAQEHSKLLLKASEFKDGRVMEYTRSRFRQAGLADGRLELRAASPYGQMLAQYADIDIALDPFPFTGCATTCDALWMGVPVITRAGETVVSRQGLSILTNLGIPQWIAADASRYQEIALDLAATILARDFDRPGLRSAMENSPLCDAAAQGKALSACLRSAWKRHNSR